MKSSSLERNEFQIGVGRSFHQPGTVNENVLESDFEPLCDGATRRRSLADLRLLEGCRFIIVSGSRRGFWRGCKFVIVSGSRWVLSLWLF